jgi:hypothetical protein
VACMSTSSDLVWDESVSLPRDYWLSRPGST